MRRQGISKFDDLCAPCACYPWGCPKLIREFKVDVVIVKPFVYVIEFGI
jgi:hypothetical protein